MTINGVIICAAVGALISTILLLMCLFNVQLELPSIVLGIEVNSDNSVEYLCLGDSCGG